MIVRWIFYTCVYDLRERDANAPRTALVTRAGTYSSTPLSRYAAAKSLNNGTSPVSSSDFASGTRITACAHANANANANVTKKTS